MISPSVLIATDDYRDITTASFVDCYGRQSILLNEHGVAVNFTKECRRHRSADALMRQLTRVAEVFRSMS
jgi:hypothetical protein